ncbi:MAG: hypothetical protein LBE55_07480 [Clostridiales bacterium]|jgi:hypothetical protein|nr:hypothetical protein [Clostridiales bacterium]
MPSEKELRTQQKTLLYDLLRLQQDMMQGKGDASLSEMIRRARVAMDEEDIALVEKIIQQEA